MKPQWRAVTTAANSSVTLSDTKALSEVECCASEQRSTKAASPMCEPPGECHEIASNGISAVPYLPRRSRDHRAHRSHDGNVAPDKPGRTMKQEELALNAIQSRQSRDAFLAAKRITATLLLAICVVAAAFL
jgi:hypothetical protein